MRVALITVAGLFLASVADAHVTVWPQQSQAGAGERYTVGVPTERGLGGGRGRPTAGGGHTPDRWTIGGFV